MNTNPDAKRILCFGDSNVRGAVPYGMQKEIGSTRWPANIRWTGVAQDILGESFEILEEGMSGRTSDFDWIWKIDNFNRNGLKHFFISLKTHRPVDMIVVCLGVNELRKDMAQSGLEIYEALKKFQAMAKEYIPGAYFLYLLPPEPVINILNKVEPEQWDGADSKYLELSKLINRDTNINSIDMSTKTFFSADDGLHMDQETHSIFGRIVATKVKEILE